MLTPLLSAIKLIILEATSLCLFNLTSAMVCLISSIEVAINLKYNMHLKPWYFDLANDTGSTKGQLSNAYIFFHVLGRIKPALDILLDPHLHNHECFLKKGIFPLLLVASLGFLHMLWCYWELLRMLWYTFYPIFIFIFNLPLFTLPIVFTSTVSGTSYQLPNFILKLEIR